MWFLRGQQQQGSPFPSSEPEEKKPLSIPPFRTGGVTWSLRSLQTRVVGVNDLGLFHKTAAGEGLCRGNFKRGGGLSDEGDEVAETPKIPFSLSWWQIPCPVAVFPGASGLGQGEQGEQENGTRSVL